MKSVVIYSTIHQPDLSTAAKWGYLLFVAIMYLYNTVRTVIGCNQPLPSPTFLPPDQLHNIQMKASHLRNGGSPVHQCPLNCYCMR